MKKIKVVLVILLIFSIYVIFKIEDNNRNYYINQKINKIYELKNKNIDKYTYIKEISQNHSNTNNFEEYGYSFSDNLINYNSHIYYYLIVLLFIFLILYIVILKLEEKTKEKRYKKILNTIYNITNNRDYKIEIEENYDDYISKIHSEIYKVSIKLKEAYEQEKNNKIYLKDMISNITHQLKTPLTIMLLNLEKYEKKHDKNTLVIVEKEIDHMNNLISSLLKLARLDINVIDFKYTKFSLLKLLEEIKKDFSLYNKTINIDILDLEITADYLFFKEAISNIIKNALEEDSDVYISTSSNKLYDEIIITNKIAKKISKKDLFERFKTTKENSAGIGLNISKTIIENHGFDIDVDIEKDVIKFIIKINKYKNI